MELILLSAARTGVTLLDRHGCLEVSIFFSFLFVSSTQSLNLIFLVNLTHAGAKLKQLEKDKGVIIRFVIGHSATPGGVLDKAIDAEDAENNDFLRLKHVEGYHQLSTKTRLYFSTAISIWDADFYVKVDDDVHLNLGMQTLFSSCFQIRTN